ncbi:hypothetical protein Tco_0924151 [Tanacetum coccineum]|uniref:Uncharacterized protein n=1 Tax=Tanacetum coccineum TaxID=301880 RepID=A0ABQ5D436_9ASTR
MQEPIITGWEMIPHPSFYHDTTKMNQSTGFEKSEHQIANQELQTPIGGSEMVVQQPSCSQITRLSLQKQEAVTEGSDWQCIAPIKVDPI